jgi:hypothetical protein
MLAALADAQAQSRPSRPASRPTAQKPKAQDTKIPKKVAMEARQFRQLQVPGDAVARNIEKLTSELQWYSTLGGALQAGKNKDLPVLWIHALGDIDGFL